MTCQNLVPKMVHRVTVQNPSRVSDGQGGFSEAWADGSTIWASIEPLKGYEKVQAMQMQSPQTHKITVRYTSEITSASRLKFGTRVFGVKEVLNTEERNRFLVIKAIERT